MMKQQVTSTQFLKIQHPAKDITTKNYSLDPDLINGWVPKLNIIGPIPLNFDHPVIDFLIDFLLKQLRNQVVYLGIYMSSRPHNTFKLHEQLAKHYHYKYQGLFKNNFAHLQPFFRKFYAQFQPAARRPFVGMNPLIKHTEILFDSVFEGGNLDAAIRVNDSKTFEYDLFMRIDSNTCGHMQWYYFKMVNLQTNKKVKINIVNFNTNKTLYQRGMKPYVFIKGVWTQGNKRMTNITFTRQTLRYQSALYDTFTQEQYIFKQLSFEFEFYADEIVEFAYCVPYSYSRMLELVKELHIEHRSIVNVTTLCESLSGIQIPLLTITNSKLPDKQKKCIFIIARQHPGQANSSYVMEGFLRWIVSDQEQAQRLRSIVVIKVVPMMNPDGVILGNYRTSICGKDLNRLFKAKNAFMFPEVDKLKDYFDKTKQQFKSRFILFIDLHGHSVRKNVFAYGPGFTVAQNNYYRARVFPKIISNQTEAFRYYSCSFRISEGKQTTARAVFCKYVPYCYTIQSSNWSYYDKQSRKEVQFSDERWSQIGKMIAISTCLYIDNTVEQQRNARIRMQKMKSPEKRQQLSLSKRKSNTKQIQLSKNHLKREQLNETDHAQEDNKIIKQIKQVEQNKQNQDKVSSDEYDSQGQDSEGQEHDLSNKELKKFHKMAQQMAYEFEDEFYQKGFNDRKDRKIYESIEDDIETNPLPQEPKSGRLTATRHLQDRQQQSSPRNSERITFEMSERKKKIHSSIWIEKSRGRDKISVPIISFAPLEKSLKLLNYTTLNEMKAQKSISQHKGLRNLEKIEEQNSFSMTLKRQDRTANSVSREAHKFQSVVNSRLNMLGMMVPKKGALSEAEQFLEEVNHKIIQHFRRQIAGYNNIRIRNIQFRKKQ